MPFGVELHVGVHVVLHSGYKVYVLSCSFYLAKIVDKASLVPIEVVFSFACFVSILHILGCF